MIAGLSCGQGEAPSQRQTTHDGGTTSEEGPISNEPVVLSVGIGFFCFDPYTENEPIFLQKGWQGGQHLNTTVVATGLEAFGNDTLRMWAENEAGEILAGIFSLEASFEPPDDLEPAPGEGSLVMRGPYLFVPEPEPLLDAEYITLHVEVLTEDNRKGEWSMTGVVEWMPDDYAEQVSMWCSAESDPQGDGAD